MFGKVSLAVFKLLTPLFLSTLSSAHLLTLFKWGRTENAPERVMSFRFIRGNSSTTDPRGRAHFSCLTSDIKVLILTLAFPIMDLDKIMLSNTHEKGPKPTNTWPCFMIHIPLKLVGFRIFFCNVFSGDEVGFNRFIFAVSNQQLRCITDIKVASSCLTRLVNDVELTLQLSIDHFSFLDRFHNEHLLQEFTNVGVAMDWADDLPAPLKFHSVPNAHMVVYAARRGKNHTMSEVHAGIIHCFDMKRDILSRLCVRTDTLVRTRRVGHLATKNVDAFMNGRSVGVFACIIVLGCDVEGSVRLGERDKEGEKVDRNYYKVPFTQKHIYDIWNAWAEDA